MSLMRLKSYPMIFMNKNTVARRTLQGFLETHGVELEPAIEVGSWDLMKRLVVSGMGIGVIPREYATRRLAEGEFNRAPALFYLWGHSYEFEKDDNWNVIEEFAEYIGNRDDIWYATNMEIFEYTEAYNRLVWAIDSKYVYNPTSFTIWFAHAGKQYVINPGEQIKVD